MIDLCLLALAFIDTACRPPMEIMPLSITTYWPFDDAGEFRAWSGQANGDPHFANGMPVDINLKGRVAACIDDWVRLDITRRVSFDFGGEWVTVDCVDQFGAEDYRQPRYDATWGEWVIPVDVMWPEPLKLYRKRYDRIPFSAPG